MTGAAFRPLCFDLATNTGWAFHDGARPVCGLWDLTAPFGDDRAAKIDSFSRRLTSIVKELQPTIIAAEKPLVPRAKLREVKGKQTAGMMVDMNALLLPWGLFTHLELACRRLELPPLRGVHHTEIKAAATGHGARWKDRSTGEWRSPDKAMVFACMRRRYPELEIATHDVADALGAMTLLVAEHRGSGAPVAPKIKIPARAARVRGRRPAVA